MLRSGTLKCVEDFIKVSLLYLFFLFSIITFFPKKRSPRTFKYQNKVPDLRCAVSLFAICVAFDITIDIIHEAINFPNEWE